MFQSYDDASEGGEAAARMARLRPALRDLDLDGFVVPRSDEHQNEYIPESAARLAWLTGFTGSAGTLLALTDRAVLFTDGRYSVQVRAQTDPTVFEYRNSVETPLTDYLKTQDATLRIGIDPWLHTMGEVAALRRVLEAGGGQLVEVSVNPVDRLWQDRPAPPTGRVRVHPERFAGATPAQKLEHVRAALAAVSADAVLLTDPSSLAWLFNLRGSDVAHTPLPIGFVLVPADGEATIFMDRRKIDESIDAHLLAIARIAPPESLEDALREASEGRRVLLDPKLVAERLASVVRAAGGTVVEGDDPVRLPRATKNATELSGARAAHRRDAAAMVTFLSWLDATTPGSVSEIDAARRLEAIRIETGERMGMPLRDISFDTISAAGPNAALPHYRVNQRSNRTLAPNSIYLVDSGGQYEDGTTDITRTVAIGAVEGDARARFTQVLKGMIAVSRARFPVGTRGLDLDPLARSALWQAGCDYAHGTGHGVGSFLAVHEGPQSISRRGTAVLESGMIVSNEPGYYREGAYGIRIENLLVVEDAGMIAGGDLPMHGFETLTFVPIDRRLIDVTLLTAEEAAWLDRYHAQVQEIVAPLVGPDAEGWLHQATRPIGRTD